MLGFAELNSPKKSKYEILQWVRGTSDEIGVICHWYRLIRERQSFTGSIRKVAVDSHGFYDCKNYVCSVPSPSFDGMESLFDQDVAHKIDLFLKNV